MPSGFCLRPQRMLVVYAVLLYFPFFLLSVAPSWFLFFLFLYFFASVYMIPLVHYLWYFVAIRTQRYTTTRYDRFPSGLMRYCRAHYTVLVGFFPSRRVFFAACFETTGNISGK